MSRMPVDKFIEQLNKAADARTVYATGGWGASSNWAKNVNTYAKRCSWNADAIRDVANKDASYFDCVCLIKGILWGWNNETAKQYGGAKYASNAVSDLGIKAIKSRLATKSTDFSTIERGEFVWINDEHCGIHVGGGVVIESTPIWENGVQYTGIQGWGTNMLHQRRWDGHGKITDWIDYKNTAPVEVDGWFGQNTAYYLQLMMGTFADGIISAQDNANKKYLPNAASTAWKFTSRKYAYGSDLIEAIQLMLGIKQTRQCTPETIKALQEYLKKRGLYRDKIDGCMGYYTVVGIQNWINQDLHL